MKLNATERTILSRIMSAYGSKGGRITASRMSSAQRGARAKRAGLAAAAKMTAEARTARARNAALARSRKAAA